MKAWIAGLKSIRTIFFAALTLLIIAVVIPLYREGTMFMRGLIMDLGTGLLSAKLDSLIAPIERRYRKLERIGLGDSQMHLAELKGISLAELERYRYKNTGRIFVLGEKGAVLLPFSCTRRDRELLFSEMGRLPDGMVDFRANGKEYVAVYRYYPRWHNYIGLAVSSQELFDPMYQLQRYSLFVAGAVILAALFVVALLQRIFIVPMVRLSMYADEVAKGGVPREIKGFFYLELALLRDRIADMVKSLVERVEEIKSREEEVRQALEMLAEEKERLAVTLRSIGDGVITTDVEGRVVLVNDVAEAMTGWMQDEAEGRKIEEVCRIIDERDGSEAENPVYKVLETGEIVTLSNHAALIAKGGSVRSIADSGAPIKDEEGRILGVVLVFRDVTEKKRLEGELLKVKKLESIGVLAGGIAHDFNNILTAILGNLNLAKMRLKDPTEVSSLLSQAERACLRARSLTTQLLTFAKGGSPVLETASIEEVVKESALFVLRGSNIKCDFLFSEDIRLVQIDVDQMSQVIQNIVLNARQAMPNGGEIVIRAANLANVSPMPHLEKGDYVEIEIRDSGPGIPPDIQDKIFDPFFTTKERGSGLGLAICHSIVEKHDGGITVCSSPGEGTSFFIYLPAAAGWKMREDEGEELGPSASLRPCKVLLMDDEEMVREAAVHMLEGLGHRAVESWEGGHAVSLYRQAMEDGDPFDVVIMDLTVPGGMGGKEAVQDILKLDPGAKVIVVSGYSDDPVMSNCRAFGFAGALTKPYRVSDLDGVIRRVLESRE